MSLTDIASIGSLISSLAVLVSLVFLAQQIRQARHAQLAAIRQQRTERVIGQNMSLVDPSYAEAVYKAQTGDPGLADVQRMQFLYYCRAVFLSGEDTFYEHQQGLLDEGAYARFRRAMQMFVSFPGVRVRWRRSLTLYEPAYVAFMAQLIAETPAFEADRTRLAADQWNADIAAEIAAPKPAA